MRLGIVQPKLYSNWHEEPWRCAACRMSLEGHPALLVYVESCHDIVPAGHECCATLRASMRSVAGASGERVHTMMADFFFVFGFGLDISR